MKQPPASWYDESPLNRRPSYYLWYGLATSTRSGYSTALNSYTTYCRSHLSNPALPASPGSLTDWCADLADRSITAKTIKSYLRGVRSAHVDRGFADLSAFVHPMLDRMVAGMKRLKGDGIPRERRPIASDILLKMLDTFDVFTRQGVTFHAAFCLAFAAFLRIGEFTWSSGDREASDLSQWKVTRASVTLSSDSLELTLLSSKTDPFRRGVTIPVAATGDAACAVASLRHLFKTFPAPRGAPLFEAVGGEAFTADLVSKTLRSILSRLGYSGHYAGHSFRRGAATEARLAGLPDSSIQLLGRWKSDCYALYVDTNRAFLLRASLTLQGH